MEEEEQFYEYESVELIPIPKGLPPDVEVEYTVCQDSLAQLEKEWKQIKDNENEMQKGAYKILEQMEARNHEIQESRKNLRIEISKRQHEKEVERISNDCEEAKKSLFERLVRGHYHAYKCITSRLKELMGKDYQAYIEQNEIEFPQIPSDSQMKTRYQQPEENKSKLSSHETEQELQRIDDMFKDYIALIKRMNDNNTSEKQDDEESNSNDPIQQEPNPNDDIDNFDNHNYNDNNSEEVVDSDPNGNNHD